MSKTIYCDRCGQPCGAPLRPEWFACQFSLPKGNWTADLCPQCLDELLAFIGKTERYATAS